ncbi:hypothetical protein GCM10010988_33200 [Cnuibacter physcomitrellae]|uniref:Uncharacterized protein n=1 Tax=Cnuibacter physcomitrellae TaxID=1619308 RepID=A0A1X9LHB9_9MICO|nr:hypothetical protein [Cnuibacter physcomitrellae]ARJ04527.1 hypothetical protein B5808_04275 [Cnuibacter physcomitrellae]GGI41260.1 hypothetical protein GCM10010988_33200 [Cnuibacter physcomitrellae]
MRTVDFSRAPRQARAEAMALVEAGKVEGVHVSPGAVARAARRAEGFVWLARIRRRRRHGVIACFRTPQQAAAFTDGLDAGWSSRVLVAERSGYSNGVWRAEGDVMRHIDRFTPTSAETAAHREPPLVARPVDLARARRRPSGVADPDRRQRLESTPLTEASAMFIGATRYRGPRALRVLSRTWYPMVARMQGLTGYVWHRVYWEPPFTLGTLAFFRTRDDLLGFARLPAHRLLMQWITRDRRNGTGGYIRLHVAEESVEGGSGAEGPR